MSTRVSAESEAYIRQVLTEGRFGSREALFDAAVRLLKSQELVSEETNGQPSLSDQEWLAEFRAWVDSHDDIEAVADDSRDSIYAGRGE